MHCLAGHGEKPSPRQGYVMGPWFTPSWVEDPNVYCSLLWFRGWTLDTHFKYGAGFPCCPRFDTTGIVTDHGDLQCKFRGLSIVTTCWGTAK